MKSTKWLTDNLKLAKALHDMLVYLELLVDNWESLIKKLQVIRLVNSENDKRLRSCFQQPSHIQDGSRAVHRVDAE
ncbi:hypothetical protein BC938DRAFT_474853 [Jimgerdemannia flammicorona]|uniref:Uncharacterized protein n=1 Tax=Jimgerdemannia flammicorona TaxID=994334 RepID=A0A433Q1G0_9FUNG|nr:hypothetical protein BC938DRAFT_474853 [Jimgerdemannia flammicorona]